MEHRSFIYLPAGPKSKQKVIMTQNMQEMPVTFDVTLMQAVSKQAACIQEGLKVRLDKVKKREGRVSRRLCLPGGRWGQRP